MQPDQPQDSGDNTTPDNSLNLNGSAPELPQSDEPTTVSPSNEPAQVPADALPTLGPAAKPAPAPQPAATSSADDGKQPGKSKKSAILTSLVVAVVLAIGAAGFIFGYYIPNRPENVWKTGMDRTADQLSSLAEKLGDPSILESLQQSKLTLKGSLDTADAKGSLNVDSRYNQDKTDSSLSLEASGDAIGQEINLNAQVKTQKVEDSIWPNVYFKLSGFKDLGLDAMLPGINDFDDKWISVEQDFYDQLNEGRQDDEESGLDVSHEDIASIASDFIDVTNEYLFTNDQEKAVIKMKEFVGTEESEGIEANHYKAQIDVDNMTEYCKAVIDKMFDNQAFRRLSEADGDEIDKERDEQKEDCDASDEAAPDYATLYEEEIDIWVDKQYKILHKIRIYESFDKKNEKYRKDKAECQERFADFDSEEENTFCDYYDEMIEEGERYMEIGQIYKGGDEVRLFTGMNSDTNTQKGSWRTDFNLNINTLAFNGQLNFNIDEEDNKMTLNLEVATEPYDGEIDSDKPEDATPLMEAYDYIMRQMSAPGGEQGGGVNFN